MSSKKFSIIVDIEEIIDRMCSAIDGNQAALAQDIGLGSSSISEWKASGVSTSAVIFFAQKHSLSLDWLFYGKEPSTETDNLDAIQVAIIKKVRGDPEVARNILDHCLDFKSVGREGGGVPDAPSKSNASSSGVPSATRSTKGNS